MSENESYYDEEEATAQEEPHDIPDRSKTASPVKDNTTKQSKQSTPN